MIRIGTSGWSYDHWTDVLYPPGLPASKRLARYVEEFDTVELNASFYRWPRDAAFTGWRQRLPDGFTMAVKAHRGLTHFRRLKSPEPWVERFERCWKALGDRAEALLVQLHPELARDDTRLDHFLGLMPDGIRVAMELRHPSWNDPAVFYAARTAPGRLRGDERRRTGLCAARDERPRLHPYARARAGVFVYGLLLRR